MRDAFGGAFSIKLMMVFLVLYVSFICVALNYSRAFRVKNRIINIIEQNEGFDFSNNDSGSEQDQIDKYLATTGYYINSDIRTYLADNSVSSCDPLYGRGYCVYNISTNPTYYGVETYIVFSLPILNVKFPIKISGETRIIETP